MKRIIKRAIRKLEEDYDGDYVGDYVGYITSQDLLYLTKLGLTLKRNHKSMVESAKRDKKAGICYSNWQYFLKPKKEVIELLNKYLNNEKSE